MLLYCSCESKGGRLRGDDELPAVANAADFHQRELDALGIKTASESAAGKVSDTTDASAADSASAASSEISMLSEVYLVHNARS